MNKRQTAAAVVLITVGLALCFGGAAAETSDVIDNMLNGYQLTYQMTTEDLIADNGDSFMLDDPDNHHVIISTSSEGLTFEAEGMSNPQMEFGRMLDNVEGVIERNQAVHVKFKPTGSKFSFSLWGNWGLWLEFDDQNKPYLGLLEKNHRESFEGDFQVEPGNWYHLLAALNTDGVIQAAMWKDGDENNAATLNLDLFQSFNENNYRNSSLAFCVSVAQQEAVTLNSYEYMTFEDFATEGRIIETGYNDIEDNGQSADYNNFGPSWRINIADNYEVIYNTIYDLLEPQVISVASGDYLGYSLWDLLELSNNGSGVATVWFNNDGENNTLVSPTYDAFIALAKFEEWAWLGAPYLITIDGLWPDPVTDIYP